MLVFIAAADNSIRDHLKHRGHQNDRPRESAGNENQEVQISVHHCPECYCVPSEQLIFAPASQQRSANPRLLWLGIEETIIAA